MKPPIDRRFSIAPMMGWTDRHCRYFHRLLSPHSLLYTVMITAGALAHGKAEQHLFFNSKEHPVALQLGGSAPEEMALSARLAEKYGYDEVNINCGCPSDRVKKGSFGACLMEKPHTVAKCFKAMTEQTSLPVTIKTRIGIDHQDSYQFLTDFVGTIAEKGCKTFIIHARKAWLNGLSPKDNRTLPPLKYHRVYQLKKDFPELEILINGGIHSANEVLDHLHSTDGVMVGREAYKNPWFLTKIEQAIFHHPVTVTRLDIVHQMASYMEKESAQGTNAKDIAQHMLGLYLGCHGAKTWRQKLSMELPKHKNPADFLIQTALEIENRSLQSSFA